MSHNLQPGQNFKVYSTNLYQVSATVCDVIMGLAFAVRILLGISNLFGFYIP